MLRVCTGQLPISFHLFSKKQKHFSFEQNNPLQQECKLAGFLFSSTTHLPMWVSDLQPMGIYYLNKTVSLFSTINKEQLDF